MKLVELLEPHTIMMMGLVSSLLSLKEKGKSLTLHGDYDGSCLDLSKLP